MLCSLNATEAGQRATIDDTYRDTVVPYTMVGHSNTVYDGWTPWYRTRWLDTAVPYTMVGVYHTPPGRFSI